MSLSRQQTWVQAADSDVGRSLLQTFDDAQMMSAIHICSKHLGTDMQQAQLHGVQPKNVFLEEQVIHLG